MFDVLISRGVKEYLYRTAEHELGRGPSVTMPEIMSQTVHDALIDSSIWALLVGAAGVTTGRLLRTKPTDETGRNGLTS
jgi:hypothetical protein